MSQRMTVDQTNRTFICSVVFVDLVDYSKKSVVEQLAIKDYFTARLAEGLKDVAVNDRIVLDTGDGAAMSFLGDPEDALFVGMSLRDSMKTATVHDITAPLKEPCSIRIGINLGPIKLVRDINGQPNIVGDGINVAQRIMSFAQPGQILVSRSYYDVVSCLSEEYGKLFTYDGSRTDKHVREHDVYVVGESESAFIHAKAGMEHRAAQTTNPKLRVGTGSTDAKGGGTDAQGFSSTALGKAAMAFLHDRTKVMIAGGVLAAVIVLLGVLLAVRKPAPLPVQTVASAASAAATAESSAKRGTDEKSAAPESSQGAPKAGAKPAAESGSAVAPGTVRLAITPWGEVYVNGKSRGISPPMKSLKLPPGKYRIEIKNSAFPPRTEVIEVQSKRTVTIKQTFK